MKKAFLILTAIFVLLGFYLIFKNQNPTKPIGPIFMDPGIITSSKDVQSRIEWEFDRLKDPNTNRIPADIRRKELLFAKELPTDAGMNFRSAQWIHRGPYNVGGRTRAAALDIDNENIIIAGGVSGGVWRSEDGGANWTKITTPNQLHNITCIAQDTRQGKRNIWYYGTGELYGNSASANGAFFLGNGIYKSYDSGLTWSSLGSTASNTPERFDELWDGIWNIATDASNDTADVIYAATLGTVFKSLDGGISWSSELGGSISNYSYFVDVALTSTGVAYATLSSEGPSKGIWRSDDGTNWYNILHDSFPSVYNRIVIGINPANENEVYFLAHTPGSGKLSLRSRGEEDWNSLWKYTYLQGNGTDSNGQWINLSENIPSNGKKDFDNFNAQGSYNMIVKVKPDNPNIVFIGGTNIFRSTDGFTTSQNIKQIGGYKIGTKRPKWEIYPNHHPDQHEIIFLPSNPDIMISANDGGLFRTTNCLESTVEWESLNNGYLTTQLYTISVDQYSTSDIIISGYQDNGNFFTNSVNPMADWVMTFNGDGSFSGIAENENYYIFSTQLGKVAKIKLDNSGNPIAFARIDPIGGRNYRFINPLVLDPNNNDILYIAGGYQLWRNDSLSYILFADNYDSISHGWFRYSDTIPYAGRNITALSVSKNPANIVYYGTNNRLIYRVDNANSGDPSHIRLSLTSLPSGGNVNCIAIDPRNANKIIAVYSNYNIYSMFYSEDGGQNWTKIAGNLEQKDDGSGNGPSCRWASILPVDGKTVFLVGTSIGLFATDELKGTSTIWTQLGANTIGNVVVEMVKTREQDGLIVVATHGNGIYSTKITSVEDLLRIIYKDDLSTINLKVYPNPTAEFINISFQTNGVKKSKITILNLSGTLIEQRISTINNEGRSEMMINTSRYASGYYFCLVEVGERKYVCSFIVYK